MAPSDWAAGAELHDRLAAAAPAYAHAEPFPHVVLDDFLPGDVARLVAAEFPRIDGPEWIHYTHVNEHKYGYNDWSGYVCPARLASAATCHPLR